VAGEHALSKIGLEIHDRYEIVTLNIFSMFFRSGQILDSYFLYASCDVVLSIAPFQIDISTCRTRFQLGIGTAGEWI